METIRQTLRSEQFLAEQEELPAEIKEAHSDIAFLRRRLERLTKLQSLLKEKYQGRLDNLSTQLSHIEMQQWELESLAKQLKKSGEKQSHIREQIASLERRRRIIQNVIKELTKYKRANDARVAASEEEQEILFQRIQDLEHILELVQQAALTKAELETVRQRLYAKKGSLEQHIVDFSKRTIDLLFEFYIPPKNSKRPKP